MTNKLQLFQGTTIRTAWDSEKEEWFFSVVDVCNVLSGSQAKDPGAYWRKLKQRLKAEGSEIVTNCHGLKLQAADGKKYLTDVLSTRDILRLIQSIPSPKAEPLKMWLAEVTTTAISRSRRPETFDESRKIAREGGNVARDTRRNIEQRIGHSVISTTNAEDKTALEVQIPEVLPPTTPTEENEKK